MNNKLFALAILLSLITVLFLAVGCDKLITQVNNNNIYDSTMGQYCITCHSDESNVILRPKGQWENSRHASADLIEATVVFNDSICLTSQCGPKCHTNEGFVNYVAKGTTSEVLKPSAIGCFTCHMPHTGPYGTWSADSLRGMTDQVDLGHFNYYTMGKSNMCVICHSAVKIPNFATSTDNQVSLDSLGINGPHFSSQANILIGYGGTLFKSTTVANSHESVKTVNGCLACHYGDGQGYSFGEHTFKLLDHNSNTQYTTNCNVASCHTGSGRITDFFDPSDTLLSRITHYGDTLAGLMLSEHILMGTDSDLTDYNRDTIVPSDVAKILVNYLLYKQDHSHGIHNAKYIYTLLKESVERWDSIPRAAFSFDDTVCEGTQLLFSNLSTGSITSSKWEFGDKFSYTVTGKGDSTHTYDTSGTFLVKLTISGSAGKTTISKSIVVKPLPHPSFTATPQTEVLGNPISFSDKTPAAQVVSRLWDFGDGIGTSQASDTTYTYLTAGTFIVWLKITNTCGIDSTADTITINNAAMKR